MEKLWNLWIIIFGTFQGLYDILNTTVLEIGEQSFTGIELLVGAGIPIVLAAIFAKWIIDFIP